MIYIVSPITFNNILSILLMPKTKSKREIKIKASDQPEAVAKLVKEVKKLKKFNKEHKPEIKYISTQVSTVTTLAQFNVAATGAQIIDISPLVVAGVNDDDRIGDSISLQTMQVRVNLNNAGANTLTEMYYRFYIVSQPINPSTAGNARDQFLEANPFSAVIDYNSVRNTNHLKDFKVLKSFSGKFEQNNLTGALSIRSKNHTYNMNTKGMVIRFATGSTLAIDNQLWMIAVASDGDRSTSNLINFQYVIKYGYTDI